MQKCLTLALFAFMNRRHSPNKRRKYSIVWGGNEGIHDVSREVFRQAIASGWIVPTSDNVATVARGVWAELRAGVLCLKDTARKALIWIYTSWISIDRMSPIIQGEYFVRDIQREYGNLRSKPVEPDGDWLDRCDWKVSL